MAVTTLLQSPIKHSLTFHSYQKSVRIRTEINLLANDVYKFVCYLQLFNKLPMQICFDPMSFQ